MYFIGNLMEKLDYSCLFEHKFNLISRYIKICTPPLIQYFASLAVATIPGLRLALVVTFLTVNNCFVTKKI